MKIQSNFINNIFPTFGTPKKETVIYCANRKMFISPTYTSEAGHHYYRGLRFSNKLVIVEKVGLYHNWTYIDEVELYAYDGTKVNLLSSYKFDKTFYNADIIRGKAESMIYNHIVSQMLISGNQLPDESSLRAMTKELMNETYQNQIETLKELKEGIGKLLKA